MTLEFQLHCLSSYFGKNLLTVQNLECTFLWTREYQDTEAEFTAPVWLVNRKY